MVLSSNGARTTWRVNFLLAEHTFGTADLIDNDAIQTAYAIREVAAADAMNTFTIISAYLIVAYLAGPTLSKFQVWAVSILYTFFCLAPITGFYQGVIDLKALDHGRQALIAVQYPWVLPGVMFAGWALSIAFMVNVRLRNPQKRKTVDD